MTREHDTPLRPAGDDAATTASLLGRAARVLPGGVLGRHRYPAGIEHLPVSGRGAWIGDADGRRFVDYSCGGGSLILGYSHPRVVAAVQRQMAEASQFVSIVNRPAIELAEAVKRAVPWVERLRFALSGAEAVMFALRLARAHTGRDKIVKFEGAYHGNSDYALWGNAPRGAPDFPHGEPDSAGIPRAIRELVLIAPYNDPDTTRGIVERNRRDLAAIIVEPVQRTYAARPEFLDELRQLGDRHGIVLIFDEIVTGFRHALGGAAERFGVTPDLAVFGKALGGGLPVSAVAGRADVMDHANPGRGGPEDGYCYVTSSQAGNPLGCAAGLAVIEELSRPGVLPQMHAYAEALKAGLADRVRRLGVEAQVIGDGPLWDLAFSARPIYDHRSSLTADRDRLMRFHVGLIGNGVMVRAGGRSYFSTAHETEEIDYTLAAAERALKGL
jgi:glutamate-1-semialdehyde 2,1-aminomutase